MPHDSVLVSFLTKLAEGRLLSQAFISYPHDLDEQDGGNIQKLALLVEREVKILSGENFKLLIDRRDIDWGRRWRDFVGRAPVESSLLIPIVAGSYFGSLPCFEEYSSFRMMEISTGIDELILSMLFTHPDYFRAPPEPKFFDWKADILARQYLDWSHLRHLPLVSTQVKEGITEVASGILRALERSRKKMNEPGRDRHFDRQGSFEILQDAQISSVLVFDDRETYSVDYREIARANLQGFQLVREDFEALLKRELLTHRAMLEYDYSCRAIPLMHGITAFVTKQQMRITIDWLSWDPKDAVHQDLWITLCRAYYVASRSACRQEPAKLIDTFVRSQIMSLWADMVARCITFSNVAAATVKESVARSVARRANEAEAALKEAFAVDARFPKVTVLRTDIGDLIVPLEMSLSFVHKALIEYGRAEAALVK